MICCLLELEKSEENAETSDLKIPDLKGLSRKVFVRIWSIPVVVSLVALVGLFMVEIIL